MEFRTRGCHSIGKSCCTSLCMPRGVNQRQSRVLAQVQEQRSTYRHFRLLPNEALEVKAVEVNAGLFGLETTAADHIHFVANRHSLVLVSAIL